MRAVVLASPGAKPLSSAVKLETAAPLPPPLKPGQALVSVRSSAANPVDVYVASGQFGGDGARGKVMAGDLAGFIKEICPTAAPSSSSPPLSFKKGDRVWALTPYFAPGTAAAAGDPKAGCWAELAVADLAWLAPAPPEEAMPLADAGAGPLVVLTAWQALEAALGPPPSEGQEGEGEGEGGGGDDINKRRLIVTAASGGVGHVAVQLAKAVWGVASVTGVASTRNRDFVLGLGADAFVDYADEAAVRAALGEGGEGAGAGGASSCSFDAAVDLLGGAWTARLARCVGGAGGGVVAHVMNRGTAEAGLEALGGGEEKGKAEIATIFVKPDGAALARASRLVAAGKLRVEVAARFPLERAGEALEAVSGFHTRGKVVVTV